MNAALGFRAGGVALLSFLLLASACKREAAPQREDHPRVPPNVILRDVAFHSAALQRDMTYRTAYPASVAQGKKLPVVYLLHGGGGDYRDWTDYSDVARFAGRGLLLVMPEGGSSYYANAAEPSSDRYEDYIVNDLIADVESRLPAASNRESRAIVGISMGGFGAVVLALRHPDLFSFAGALSPALDVPTRPFSVKRWDQWKRHRAIFGPWRGEREKNYDPYALAAAANEQTAPYLFVTCGNQEGLLAANRRFAALLRQRNLPHEFHAVAGGHNWNQWNAHIGDCFARWLERMPGHTAGIKSCEKCRRQRSLSAGNRRQAM